jgi:SAM-dependent methyltransferase
MTDPSARTGAFTSASLPANYEAHLAPYLFQPWAEILLDAVAPAPGAAVLDVASGTGVVARAAARRVGADGRVVATDISPAMIEFNASHDAEPAAASIETAIAAATELNLADAEFDVVLCQQGMPFFPDRPGAVREMRRVLRPGGVVGIAVWTPGHDVAPFGNLNDVLRELGADEPFPGAWDNSSFVLSPAEVETLLTDAGFTEVDAREVELLTRWPGLDSMTAALTGTPFGPLLAAMDDEHRSRADARIAERFTPFVSTDGAVELPTYSVIARATA